MKAKYKVTTGIYKDHEFYGYILNDRVVDDHTVGRSYPIDHCKEVDAVEMKMTTEEFTQLEKLFDKLCMELGGSPICILNGVFADGWHIGVYEKAIMENNKDSGAREVGRKATGMNLEMAAKTIKSCTK